MKAPQERMNYIIQKLNKAKKSKWGGDIFFLENNLETLSNKIFDFYSGKY